MATKRVKSALPRAAAKRGPATAATIEITAPKRAKLPMRVIGSPLFVRPSLEAIAEVEADQVRVRLVSAVEVVALRGQAVRAAGLEVQRELGEVDDERSA